MLAESSPSQSVPAPPSAGRLHSSRPSLTWAVVVGCVWLVTLFVITVTTSNPVTLNRVQIRNASTVVEARIEDLGKGVCLVKKTWIGKPLPPQIRVSRLQDAGAKAGRIYLLPLIPAHATLWAIAPTPLPDKRPLIYPATPAALEQLKALQDGEQ